VTQLLDFRLQPGNAQRGGPHIDASAGLA